MLTRFIRMIEVSTQGTATIVQRAVTYDGRCVIVTTLADALTVIAFKDREIRLLREWINSRLPDNAGPKP